MKKKSYGHKIRSCLTCGLYSAQHRSKTHDLHILLKSLQSCDHIHFFENHEITVINRNFSSDEQHEFRKGEMCCIQLDRHKKLRTEIY